MYLTIYDLSGIQNFIFQTNKMKEVIGASYLVSRALFENVPYVLEENPDKWKTRSVDDFKNLPECNGMIVYIGGGNALVLFEDEQRAKAATRDLQERVFLQTGGALRLCSSEVEIDDADNTKNRLSNYQKDYMAKLDYVKRRAPFAATAPGFSINALDNETFEPLLYFSADNGESHYRPRSRHLKLQEESRVRQIIEENRRTPKGYHNHLVDQFKGYKFMVKDFFNREDRGKAYDTQGKHFLATVHIDGNTMGQRIKDYAEGLSEQDLLADLISMRDMSRYISETYENALKTMVDSVYETEIEAGSELPFRPIISDGDDITFICRSDKAFECVTEFIKALNKADPLPDSYKEGLPRPEEFSVGVGIVFANESYPFSTAHELAEELCKNAKGMALKRKIETCMESGESTKNAVSISSIDFHVCYGEITSNIKDYRERFCATSDCQLTKRPYHEPLSSGHPLSFFELQEQLRRFNKAVTEGWIARGKLKELHGEYSKGKSFAEHYGKYIVARNEAILKAEDSDDKEKNEERSKFIDELGEVFEPLDICVGAADHHHNNNSSNNNNKAVACFYDALDILDICTANEEVAK
jgi:hypothetical protein